MTLLYEGLDDHFHDDARVYVAMNLVFYFQRGDPRGRRELIHLINGLTVTKIIASHDLEFILETCRRVIVLDAGRVVADGSARTLLADRDLMNAHGLEVPHSLTPHVDRHHSK